MDKKTMYVYETNLKYTANNSIVHITGANKKELDEYFKDLGVKFGKRNTSVLGKMYVERHSNYLEVQRKTLIKYLQTKKIYFIKEV